MNNEAKSITECNAGSLELKDIEERTNKIDMEFCYHSDFYFDYMLRGHTTDSLVHYLIEKAAALKEATKSARARTSCAQVIRLAGTEDLKMAGAILSNELALAARRARTATKRTEYRRNSAELSSIVEVLAGNVDVAKEWKRVGRYDDHMEARSR